MTVWAFLTLYPQFSAVPADVTEHFVSCANLRFSYLEETADEARMLWTAHRLTLYAMTRGDGTVTGMAQLAEDGQPKQVTGKKVGDVSLTMTASGGSSSAAAFADLDLTAYGRQLAGMLAGGTVYVR